MLEIQNLAQLLFECDEVEIIHLDKYFLLLGFNRHSKGEWERNGEPIEFNYVKRHCIASGKTRKELRESLFEYYRICQIDMKTYLLEQV